MKHQKCLYCLLVAFLHSVVQQSMYVSVGHTIQNETKESGENISINGKLDTLD